MLYVNKYASIDTYLNNAFSIHKKSGAVAQNFTNEMAIHFFV